MDYQARPNGFQADGRDRQSLIRAAASSRAPATYALTRSGGGLVHQSMVIFPITPAHSHGSDGMGPAAKRVPDP